MGAPAASKKVAGHMQLPYIHPTHLMICHTLNIRVSEDSQTQLLYIISYVVSSVWQGFGEACIHSHKHKQQLRGKKTTDCKTSPLQNQSFATSM